MLTDYDFLASAEAAHTAAGLDFPKIFDTYFTTGWVQKTPVSFIMAGHCPGRSDAWLVWWAEMHPAIRGDRKLMLKRLMSLMPHRRPYIAFARGLREKPELRFYSTSRMLRLTR